MERTHKASFSILGARPLDCAGAPYRAHLFHCTYYTARKMSRGISKKNFFIFSKFLLTFQIFCGIIYSQGKERKQSTMTNLTVFNKMINQYNRLSFTHNYIFGFADRGTIYAVVTNSSVLPLVCCLDISSRNGGYSLRFKPTKAQKEFLKTFQMKAICSEKYFEEIAKNSKYNRGEIFEKMVTEFVGQEWKKDNVPFTKDGDITINGIAYQIKFNKATFANEKSLENLTK